MIPTIISLIISGGFCLIGYINFRKSLELEKKAHEKLIEANNITVQKNINQNEIIQQEQLLIESIENKQKELNSVEEELSKASKEFIIYKNSLDENFFNAQKEVDLSIEKYKEKAEEIKINYLQSLDQQKEQYYNNYLLEIKTIDLEKEKVIAELDKIKSTLTAAQKAQLRETEKEEDKDFYKIQLDKNNEYEIKVIKSIEGHLRDARPLRMLIWSTYYTKKANELCARVIGTTKTSGIYKITYLKDNRCYIGQARDIKERWREHMKCGLGIDTPAGSKLYSAMLRHGLEDFTFEVLEECPIDQLNEKEKFYIDLYQSYDYGFNSTKGNK